MYYRLLNGIANASSTAKSIKYKVGLIGNEWQKVQLLPTNV